MIKIVVSRCRPCLRDKIKKNVFSTLSLFLLTGKKMDDYAKARYKTTRKLTVLKMIEDNGGMNPDMSLVDFVQDGDLNKSLEHFVRVPSIFSFCTLIVLIYYFHTVFGSSGRS